MASSWKITGQLDNQLQFVAGQPVTGHLITFVTGNGWEASVFVPETQYSAPRVKAIIQAKANVTDEVGGLAVGTIAIAV